MSLMQRNIMQPNGMFCPYHSTKQYSNLLVLKSTKLFQNWKIIQTPKNDTTNFLYRTGKKKHIKFDKGNAHIIIENRD